MYKPLLTAGVAISATVSAGYLWQDWLFELIEVLRIFICNNSSG